MPARLDLESKHQAMTVMLKACLGLLPESGRPAPAQAAAKHISCEILRLLAD